MNTAEQILVVFLSGALAVFLVIGIIVGLHLIRLMTTLQNIAFKAESLASSAEAVGDMFRHAVGRLTLMKFVKGVMDMVHDKAKKGDK